MAISGYVSVPPRNNAGYETFHLWSNRKSRNSYIEAMRNNSDFTSEVFLDYQSSVSYTLFV